MSKTNEVLKAIEEAQSTPCMKCLQKAQREHIACYVTAGNDAEKKAICDRTLNAAIKACPCP